MNERLYTTRSEENKMTNKTRMVAGCGGRTAGGVRFSKVGLVTVLLAGLGLNVGVEATSGGQPQGTGGLGAVKFIRWVEPKERSFSVDVPAGWRVEGGLNWLGQIDPQGYVRAQSPDGKVQVFMGDPDLLGRQVPGRFSLMQTGVAEGQIFRTPAGGPAKMQRYLTGAQYAKEHVSWRLCGTPSWVAGGDMPDVSRTLTEAVAPEARKYNIPASASAGDVTFTCGTAQGAVFAATVLGGNRSQIQVWAVYKLAGFLSADPLRSMQARYIMEHMLASVTPNQAWTEELERRTMQLTGAVISMQNAATQAQLAASRQQNETLARMNHPNQGVSSRSGGGTGSGARRVYEVSGNKRVCDAIGRCASVSNDSDNMYMDHSGAIRSGPVSGGPPDNTGKWAPVFVQR